jgi:hypothetical protein
MDMHKQMKQLYSIINKIHGIRMIDHSIMMNQDLKEFQKIKMMIPEYNPEMGIYIYN